ncbi:DUF4238 domain-containing protein [Marmoricola sp. URHB0036]|uniref:DUF4238 domain-containing protein n=1 Tax=Marmoricola sp. URHB0036 TaxID=1298863 RepID=UPI0018CA185E
MPEDDDDQKVADLFERARKIEANRGGRKQHLVPASYLHRWTEDGQVRVTDVESRRSYCARPETVGREADFYRLEADGLEPDECHLLRWRCSSVRSRATRRPGSTSCWTDKRAHRKTGRT